MALCHICVEQNYFIIETKMYFLLRVPLHFLATKYFRHLALHQLVLIIRFVSTELRHMNCTLFYLSTVGQMKIDSLFSARRLATDNWIDTDLGSHRVKLNRVCL
ncbi:hypothetical protein XENTR_v10002756 [Xenopus tropicalis]|nr:hypothetical protein XENTR_v10002756 [Xenopus tropicalis]